MDMNRMLVGVLHVWWRSKRRLTVKIDRKVEMDGLRIDEKVEIDDREINWKVEINLEGGDNR